MEENENVREAGKNLEKLKQDEHAQYLAWLREKQILDMNSMKKDGFLKGREEGRTEEKKQIARKMLKKGIDVEIIIETTELSIEEIEKIKLEETK